MIKFKKKWKKQAKDSKQSIDLLLDSNNSKSGTCIFKNGIWFVGHLSVPNKLKFGARKASFEKVEKTG